MSQPPPGGPPRARVLLVAGLLALAWGCIKVGPDYTPPQDQEVPDAWEQAAIDGLAEGESSVQTWWNVFDDPILHSLIERSGTANLDLEAALYRVQEARALRGISTGERVPFVEGGGSYDRGKQSENGLFPSDGEAADLWGIGAGATWEIDVCGRIARSVESATAGFEASVEDYRDVLVSVFAEVAVSYMDVRAFQERIDFARANVDTQTQTLELVQDRFDAGLVSALDIAQAEANLASTRVDHPEPAARPGAGLQPPGGAARRDPGHAARRNWPVPRGRSRCRRTRSPSACRPTCSASAPTSAAPSASWPRRPR